MVVIIQLWINEMFIHFSGNQESIISFIKIKNLIKNLLTVIKLPVSTPK